MLNNLKLTFFGESHAELVGFTVEGIPAGIEINEFLIREDLQKRRPKTSFNTSRVEQDNFTFVSGMFNGFTTGVPLTVLVDNNQHQSNDYRKGEIRPSHSDYPAYVKFGGFNDFRGGGVFSGRLTVLHVIVGSICKQILAKSGIVIGSEITNVNGLENEQEMEVSAHNLNKLNEMDFCSFNQGFIEQVQEIILDAKHNDDSVGGKVTTYAVNLPIGLGDVFFNSCESRIAHMFFSIPSVKGVSFGMGENFANLFGREANDELYFDYDSVKFKTNNAGGINGGLTNGQPLIVNTTFKAPASIGQKQASINLVDRENIELEIIGRHDAFILDRVCVVLNNALAIVLLDLLIDSKKHI